MRHLALTAFILITSLIWAISAQTNVALNKTVTVNTFQTGNGASNAVDGNTSTRWCASSGATPQWLMVDLGGNYAITRTEVMWEQTVAYKYKVETSTDNSSWTQRADRTANTASQQTFIDYFSITARYIRITATGLPSGSWASIFEFRVFGTSATTAPVITTQPANQTVTEGQSTAFTIAATGNPAPSYQWRRNGTNISGATGTSYTITSTAMTDSGAVFSCVVNNSAGSVTSSNAVLTVHRNLRRQDSLALVALYNGTGGPNWLNKTNWLTAQPIDTWVGVSITSGRVTQLRLNGNRLTGLIPSEIGNLTNLEILLLYGNNLTGQIPTTLGNLKNLMELDIYDNQLSGQIPSTLGNLTNLWNLICENNQLSGPIPPELGNLTHLYRFIFRNNQLTGAIPPEIGNLSYLTDLYLNGNGLTGPVPPQLGKLSQLMHLLLNNNALTNLPDSISYLSNVTQCDLGNNLFCNTTPAAAAWANAHDPDWASLQACGKPEIQILASPLSGAVPLTVTFSANTITGVVTTWAWTFGDGGTATSQNTSHIYNNAGNYTARLIATGFGGADTAIVNVQVAILPSIITQPVPQTLVQGGTATFSVVATGTAPLSYLWYKNGSIISGATASTYTKNNVQQADTGSYFIMVSNVAGLVTSTSARLTVILPPVITTQPVSQTVNQGAPVTFSVFASGTAPLSYQWRKNGTNISGATVSSYTITSSQVVDTGSYTVMVSNSAGNVTSTAAHLTVIPTPFPPVITRDPESQIVSIGGSVKFSIVVTGTQPLSYTWQKNGTTVGSNASELSISPVSFLDSGFYQVIVTNAVGRDTSNSAKLTVVPVTNRPTKQLMRISGMLSDTSGTPVGVSSVDTIEATVRLFDSLNGGTVQYTEFFRKADGRALIVNNGAFTLYLGQGTTTDSLLHVLALEPSLWVEITVDGQTPDVLQPRLPLNASPFSLSTVQGSAN